MATIIVTKTINLPWKNQVAGEPLDLVQKRRWSSWGPPMDKCKICNLLDHCYECIFEWGDTRHDEYVSELCHACLFQIMKTCRNVTEQKLKEFERENF